MRLLIFANATASIAHGGHKHGYNGGGWVSSLINELVKREGLTLSLAGLSSGISRKVVTTNATCYLVCRKIKSNVEKLLGGLQPSSMKYEKQRWAYYESEFRKIVDDFHPDVIHIFGTEFYYGLVSRCTYVPIVLHLQGILNPYLNAFFPPGVTLLKYCLQSLNLHQVWSRYQTYMEWKRDCNREIEIFKGIKNYIGRTEWDKACSRIYSPNSRYFYGSELLRPCFYQDGTRELPEMPTIITTISQPMYKGYDMVLKTASLLTVRMGVSFRWRVFGNIDPSLIERAISIRHENVNVELCGVATAEQLRDELLHCTCYFHSSYIDNSPNSVCEAQIMGVPVVVTHVGGEASLVEEGVTGYLVPANDPYMAAWRIYEMCNGGNKNRQMGENAKTVALKRHSIEDVVDGLIKIYEQLIIDSHHLFS